jgi:hypothetical protein
MYNYIDELMSNGKIFPKIEEKIHVQHNHALESGLKLTPT